MTKAGLRELMEPREWLDYQANGEVSSRLVREFMLNPQERGIDISEEQVRSILRSL